MIKNKNLGLIFSRKVSISLWESSGYIDREFRYLEKLAESFSNIYLFTYGSKKKDIGYKEKLPSNIKLVYKPIYIPNLFYVFLMPIIHRNIFNKIDSIKTNQMDGSWAGVIAKKIFNKKLIVRCGYEWLNYLITTNASWYKKKIARIVENWSYKNADIMVITSTEDKDFISSNFGVSREKIEVIGNYIDTNLFIPDASILKKENRIIFIGRLHKDKNLLMLIRSLEGIDCELVLIGNGPEGEKIRKTASILNVNINLLGKVSQNKLPKELQKSSIFVLPSKSEGNPKALLEAMSCGLPCVGTNVKGIKEVIDDGETGLLAELNPEDLRQKIITLLENKELRDRLGRNAREKIIANQSLDIIVEKELKLYESIL